MMSYPCCLKSTKRLSSPMTGMSQGRLNARRGNIGRATARLVSVVSICCLLLPRSNAFQCIDHFYLLLLQADLSKRVATSWHNADGEVKLFCAEVSDILMQAYKKALYRKRKDDINYGTDELSTQPHGAKVTNDKKRTSRCNTLPPSQVLSSTAAAKEVDIAQIISSATVTQVPCPSAVTSASDVLEQITSLPSIGQLSLPIPSYHCHYRSATEVDIDDDAIRNMWMACD